MTIPSVKYRFKDAHLATWFIEKESPMIQDIIKSWGAREGDYFIEAVAAYICNYYIYPLTNANQPACDGQILRYRKGPLSGYLFSDCEYYVWGLVGETIASGYSYCAESANLGTSILLNKIPDALTCLGAVMNLDDDVQGYHAWCQLTYKGEPTVLESTIHTIGANNLAKAISVYDKGSDWAKQGGIWYKLMATMNDKEYFGDTSIVTRMHLPAKFQPTWNMTKDRKKIAKKYYNEGKVLHELLNRAWGV